MEKPMLRDLGANNMIAKLENIGLKINKNSILKDINLELKKGEITTLIGPNGGGKTSIARILLGLLNPTNGKVIKDPGLKIGYMPQRIEIEKTIPLTALDFLLLFCLDKKLNQDLKNLIEKLGIKKILNHQLYDLSGGQLQKVLFLSSIINKPNLIVLDEPTQYMDINATQDFYKVVDEVRKTNNCAVLLISHDLHMVMQKTDFVFCVNHHICCHGTPESVNQHPEYISLFGQKGQLTIYQHHHDHQH
jgi:zinc transport system ATP-binding protein